MLHERLRDGDTSFGLKQAEYARREKMRRRDREKKRRQRAIQALRAKAIVMVERPNPVGVYRSTCGLLAYHVRGLDQTISLPFVSILGRDG